MRLAQRSRECGAIARVVQIGMRRALAAAGVGDGADVGQMRRVDQHHVGAVGRQRPTGHRPGEDARQIEHEQTFERPHRCRQIGPAKRRRVADSRDLDQRQRCDGGLLWMRLPLLERAQRSGDEPGIGGGLLERLGLPAFERSGDLFACRARPRRQAEPLQQAVSMVREVGVQPDPAARIAKPAAIQAGQRVPQLHIAPVEPESAAGFERGFAHVDGDALNDAVAGASDFRCRQCGCGQRCLHGGADGERRRQRRLAAVELQAVECLIRQR